jgi:hypothetical protein
MKVFHGISFVSIASLLNFTSGQEVKCVEGGYVLEFDGECNTVNFKLGYEGIFNRESECTNTFEEDLRLQLNLPVTASDDEVNSAIRKICEIAWDNYDTVPFKRTHRKKGQFEQIYYNGGTYWNEEVETLLETGERTNYLKEDSKQVLEFFESFAQSSQVEWPGDLPNFELDKCELNAAMCCWPQDRQANDGNGNCKEPYDTACYDKDPADNTDLCYVDVSRSPHTNKLGEAGYMTFPQDDNNGEGAVHCHGFAWSNDKYDFTSRYKGNNLFYVSMYDHMRQRGYVRNIPGAPMCACIEQMPTVTRSDCTQIDVDESYRIEYNDRTKKFNAELTNIEIEFNSCQGRYNQNNDLFAYYLQLAQDRKVSFDQSAEIYKYLVEDDNCDEAVNYYMAEKGFKHGYNHDESIWFKVAGSNQLHKNEIGREGFREMLKENGELQIVWRVCTSCTKPSHQHIFYRRFTLIPDEMDLLDMLLNSWTNTSNVENTDFKLYSTFDDAVNDENAWTFYDFDDGKGFPANSGPYEKDKNQHRKFSSDDGQENVAFYVMKSRIEGGIVPYAGDGPVNGIDIGNPIRPSDVLIKSGAYYLTAAGDGIGGRSDQFYFLQEPPASVGEDITLTAYISSFQTRGKFSKAGLMIRESNALNSAHIFCFLGKDRDVVAQWRGTTGRGSSTSDDTWTYVTEPTWLKLSKTAGTYTCSKSQDGTNWVEIKTKSLDMNSETVYVGMALTADSSSKYAEAVFENYNRV